MPTDIGDVDFNDLAHMLCFLVGSRSAATPDCAGLAQGARPKAGAAEADKSPISNTDGGGLGDQTRPCGAYVVSTLRTSLRAARLG